jgi:hypothetical protein
MGMSRDRETRLPRDSNPSTGSPPADGRAAHIATAHRARRRKVRQDERRPRGRIRAVCTSARRRLRPPRHISRGSAKPGTGLHERIVPPVSAGSLALSASKTIRPASSSCSQRSRLGPHRASSASWSSGRVPKRIPRTRSASS